MPLVLKTTRMKRLEFGESHVHMTINQLKIVFVKDQSSFPRWKNYSMVPCRKTFNQKYTRSILKHGGRNIIWGGFSRRGPVYRINGNMDKIYTYTSLKMQCLHLLKCICQLYDKSNMITNTGQG